MSVRAWTAAVVAAALLYGCATPPHAPSKPQPSITVYELAHWSDLPGWGDDAVTEAWPAFLESCRTLRFNANWAAPCTAAQTVNGSSAADIRTYFAADFEPYEVIKRTGPEREATGLVTGYFEPLLRGSRTRSPHYMAPLYAPPPGSVDRRSHIAVPGVEG